MRKLSHFFIKELPLLVVGIVCIRTFLLSTFYIPSGSMLPSLRVGDVVLASKFSYGFCKFSLPFGYMLPGLSGRILDWHKPQRGDVVVFRLPDNNSTDFVKRVIGLPKDRISIRQGRIYVNNAAVEEKAFAVYHPYMGGPEEGVILHRFLNKLPYTALKTYTYGEGPADTMTEITVPDNHYFMIGDNFDHSQDSRFLHAVGPIPADHIIGRVEIIVASYDYKQPHWPMWKNIMYPPVLWERFLKIVA